MFRYTMSLLANLNARVRPDMNKKSSPKSQTVVSMVFAPHELSRRSKDLNYPTLTSLDFTSFSIQNQSDTVMETERTLSEP
jgi:hypothetical protein